MIVPGVTRPLTDLERCQERTNKARQAVLLLADQYGAQDRYTTHTGRLEHALRTACVELHQAVNRQSALEEDRQTSANPTLEDT